MSFTPGRQDERRRRPVALLLGWSAMVLGLMLVGRTDAAPGERPEAALVSALERKYGLEVVRAANGLPVRTRHGLIEGSPADPKEVDTYLRTLIPEWERYSPALIRLSAPRRIVLCQNLAFAGQRRAAVPDFEHDDLHLDVSRGKQFPEYVRKVIHHEFFHVLDWRDDGRLYEDPVWAALNTPGFRYGSGGVNAQDDRVGSLLDERLTGFLTRYSLAGVEEDKAEVFAHLMIDPGYVEVRAGSDPVLRAKVQRIKLLLWRAVPELHLGFWLGR